MRILVVTQYFWPENFRINDLVIGLIERGHEVEVLTGKPNYPKGDFYDGYSFLSKPLEIWNGANIHRSPLIPRGGAGGVKLMLNYLSFAIFCSMKALTLRGSFDKILVYEPSPITVGIPAIVVKLMKKAKIYFWVQDLWPQSVTAAGGVSNKFVIGCLNKISKWIYKKSDKILIQSEGFRETLLAQNVANDKIIYYPNSVESLFSVREAKKQIIEKLPNGFKIMFAGNIGESQDFETLVEAARIVANVNKDIKWVILGDGRKKEFVQEKIKEFSLEAQFYLLGSYAVEMMPDFFACSDVLLVSLKKSEIFSLTIPSKVQSYLACGKPIIGALDGEGAKIIADAGAGFVAPSGNSIILAEKILALYHLTPTDLSTMGINARKYFESNFEREKQLDKLLQIFDY